MIWVWGVSQKINLEVEFRIEDHDTSRVRPHFIEKIVSDTHWLGFTKHLPIDKQSNHSKRYQDIAALLFEKGLVYACTCSRKDIARDHQNDLLDEPRYPGTCRRKNLPFNTPNASLRVSIEDQTIEASDLLCGELSQNPFLQCGDLLIRDRNGLWTYQFCVVADDLAQKIDLIIRGDDLKSSVGRQLALRSILEQNMPTPGTIKRPLFIHHPLLFENDRGKLSKRLNSKSIESYRGEGWTPENLLGLAAFEGGLLSQISPVNAEQCWTLIPKLLPFSD
jgi:glutamyl-tRNA synthetase/glutamyl-Q tRNA(Asp) synthetase